MLSPYLRSLCALALVVGLAWLGMSCQAASTSGGGQADEMMGGDMDTNGGDMDDTTAGAGLLFTASLGGDSERPDPVDTSTTGSARFAVAEDVSGIDFTIEVLNGIDITAAHIHEGGPQVAGEVVAGLFAGSEAQVNGQLISGTITADDLAGSLEGMGLLDLIDLLTAGQAYVNVHSAANPAGEIRGQLTMGDGSVSEQE